MILSQGKRSYLDAIHARYEVHGTVYKEKTKKLMHVPDYVVNHGILSGLDLHELLQRTKVGGDREWERIAWKERGNIGCVCVGGGGGRGGEVYGKIICAYKKFAKDS